MKSYIIGVAVLFVVVCGASAQETVRERVVDNGDGTKTVYTVKIKEISTEIPGLSFSTRLCVGVCKAVDQALAGKVGADTLKAAKSAACLAMAAAGAVYNAAEQKMILRSEGKPWFEARNAVDAAWERLNELEQAKKEAWKCDDWKPIQ
jgi:hypothetical protein